MESPGITETIKSLDMTGNIVAPESIKSHETARKLVSPGVVGRIDSPEVVMDSESSEIVSNAIPSEMTMKIESPNVIQKTESEPQEITRDIASSDTIGKIGPPKVLKKIIFPKAINKIGSSEAVEKTLSSGTPKKSELPETNGQIVSPEVAKTSPLVSIKNTVELPESNKSHTESITSVEAANKELNSSWGGVDLNRTIKQEDEDEDFNLSLIHI